MSTCCQSGCKATATHFNHPANNKPTKLGRCRECFEAAQARLIRESFREEEPEIDEEELENEWEEIETLWPFLD